MPTPGGQRVDVDAELLEDARARGECDGLTAAQQLARWARLGRLFEMWAAADPARVRLALTGEGLTDAERELVDALRRAGTTSVDLPGLLAAAAYAATSSTDEQQAHG